MPASGGKNKPAPPTTAVERIFESGLMLFLSVTVFLSGVSPFYPLSGDPDRQAAQQRRGAGEISVFKPRRSCSHPLFGLGPR